MIRNKDLIIEIDYKFYYVNAKGNREIIKDVAEYNNIREVEFIFNQLTSINTAEFVIMPKEIRQAYIDNLVAFRDRINALASDKIHTFIRIHADMA